MESYIGGEETLQGKKSVGVRFVMHVSPTYHACATGGPTARNCAPYRCLVVIVVLVGVGCIISDSGNNACQAQEVICIK